jgi:predicted CoA-binding protein
VPLRLKRRGFAVVPINPSADELFGERAYPSLDAMPAPVDIVQVFRPSEEAGEIAKQAVARHARALWLQLGIRSPEARRIAEAGGIDFVEDHCMGDESDRYGVRKP